MVPPSDESLQADAVSAEAQAVSDAVRELSLCIRDYERHLAALMRLRPMEYQAMDHILDGRGSLGPRELAHRLGLAPGTTTEMLDRLEQLGHVVRARDENDGRRVKLAPTVETTQQIVAALTPAMHDLGMVAERLEPAERDVVLRFLREAGQAIAAHTSLDEHSRHR